MTEGHFEAKKHAYRQSQEGIVVSFVIHPNDVPESLALAPLGTRLMVAFSEIGDEPNDNRAAKGEASGDTEAPRETARRKFDELPPSQQAGILANDPEFAKFMTFYLGDVTPVEVGEQLAAVIRLRCGVASRVEFDDRASPKWLSLLGHYRNWQADQRWGSLRRGS